MAVEARHHNIFPPQFLGNREMVMMNSIEANGNMFQTQMGYGVEPFSGTPTTTATAAAATVAATTERLLPLYNSLITDSVINQKAAAAAAAAAMKSESTLTYNNLPLPRKRSRDSINPILSFPSPVQVQQSNNNNKAFLSPFSFLGNDISLQMEQQQLDIDHLVSHHMERVRMEIEERRKREARKIMAAIEGGVMKRLRAKEEEIEKIGKLNWALEERVKSLCIENQIWRDLAQTNEATANALRTNLEQVLAAQVKDERTRGLVGGEEVVATVAAANDELVDDAQSCCGSNWETAGRRMVAAAGEEESKFNNNNNNGEEESRSSGSRLCKNCRKEESCVLLLPCRHLCLCTVCGSNLHICPICKSTKNGSVHVNIS